VHASESDYNLEVHLRTLSTNVPHPKALVSVFSPAFLDTDLIPPIMIVRVEISGNMLALLYVDRSGSCKALEIWNWVEFPHHSVRSLHLFFNPVNSLKESPISARSETADKWRNSFLFGTILFSYQGTMVSWRS
jgi:hypothetical protein